MQRAFAIVALVAGFATVTAAAIASPAAVITVVPGVVHRGHTVTVRGNAGSCPVGDRVTIISRAFVHTHDFAGLPAVYARVRAGGKFRVATRIPATKRPGRYGVTARCGGGNFGVMAHIRVLR